MNNINWQLVPQKLFWTCKQEVRCILTENCGFSYAARKWFCVILNLKSIKHLDHNFHYIDRLTPFFLFDYINEVKDVIKKYDYKLTKSIRVLEIGGNIGGWGAALCNLLPNAFLYSFEPNPVPFKYLEKNSLPYENWKVFGCGIGAETESVDFFSYQRSLRKDQFMKKMPIKTYYLNLM